MDEELLKEIKDALPAWQDRANRSSNQLLIEELVEYSEQLRKRLDSAAVILSGVGRGSWNDKPAVAAAMASAAAIALTGVDLAEPERLALDEELRLAAWERYRTSGAPNSEFEAFNFAWQERRL